MLYCTPQLSGDMLCSHNFDLGQVHDFFRKKVRHCNVTPSSVTTGSMQNGELAIYYELEAGESVENRGIIEMNHLTSK